jgi:hypothetical protein
MTIDDDPNDADAAVAATWIEAPVIVGTLKLNAAADVASVARWTAPNLLKVRAIDLLLRVNPVATVTEPETTAVVVDVNAMFCPAKLPPFVIATPVFVPYPLYVRGMPLPLVSHWIAWSVPVIVDAPFHVVDTEYTPVVPFGEVDAISSVATNMVLLVWLAGRG